MITVMNNKGFHFAFDNGITISIQIGAGNYCDNYDKRIGFERTVDHVSSKNAEIAAWTTENGWFDWEENKFIKGSDVKGYVPTNEVLDYIEKFRNWKFG